MRRTRRALRADDDGSVLPLTLGYAVLAIAAILVCVDATSLYLAQQRLDALADAASLAGADGFTVTAVGAEVRAELDDASVNAQAAALLRDAGNDAVLVAAGTPDGRTARVTLAAVWHPPVFSLFVPAGVALRATATSRTALR